MDKWRRSFQSSLTSTSLLSIENSVKLYETEIQEMELLSDDFFDDENEFKLSEETKSKEDDFGFEFDFDIDQELFLESSIFESVRSI